jgi:RNase P subunit RPR2
MSHLTVAVLVVSLTTTRSGWINQYRQYITHIAPKISAQNLYPLGAETASACCANCIRLMHKLYPLNRKLHSLDAQTVSVCCANCIRLTHKMYPLNEQTAAFPGTIWSVISSNGTALGPVNIMLLGCWPLFKQRAHSYLPQGNSWKDNYSVGSERRSQGLVTDKLVGYIRTCRRSGTASN